MGKETEIKKPLYVEDGFEVVEEKEVHNLDAFKGGMDFFLQGGKSEFGSIRKRLVSLQIPNEEIKKLGKLKKPPQPDFQVKSLEEVRTMGRFAKKSYKSKMDKFEKRRAAWDLTKDGIAWKEKLAEIMDVSVDEVYSQKKELQSQSEEQIKEEKTNKKSKEKHSAPKESGVKKTIKDFSQLTEKDIPLLDTDELENYIDYKTKEVGYEDIAEDPDEMDEALKKEESEEFRKNDKLISLAEIRRAAKLHPKGQTAAKLYMSIGTHFAQMNRYFRDGGGGYGSLAEALQKMIGHAKLSRDMVSKRGVNGINTIAYMMGLENAGELSIDEIKQKLQDKINNGDDIILQEKGFCSTSINTKGYSAGTGEKLDEAGIEFIILNKKGTKGLNYTNNGSLKNEDELLLNAGTKFKVLKICFNDGSEENREILNGNPKSWKVYMTTIPNAKDDNNNEDD